MRRTLCADQRQAQAFGDDSDDYSGNQHSFVDQPGVQA